jgi:hypothetical protein
MLRLIHAQSYATHSAVPVSNILIDDIDDGLPNKPVHTLGSTGDPKAYKREGYALAPKQACYVTRNKVAVRNSEYASIDASVPGYVDLRETERVTLSWKKGKIFKFAGLGYITVVGPFSESLLAAPTITLTSLTTNLVITGTGFLSETPDISTVAVTIASTGGNQIILKQSDIVSSGGSFSDTSVTIPLSLLPGLADGDVAVVRSNAKLSNSMAVGRVPVLTTAALVGGDLVLTGTSFMSTSPMISYVIIGGTGAGTLSWAQITANPAAVFTDTNITVKQSSLPAGVAASTSTVKVQSDGNDSNTRTVA